MVQVSYPGVYIREVSSGARTITGVSTAIAAFVGRARQGQVLTPTRVLGFVDYQRAFSDDTSVGELTDQVRQFFQNGGQQAFIVRIANNAESSELTLQNSTGSNVLILTARSPGTDGAQLRTSVDYNTASPERTFNLRIFREILDANGNSTIQDDEFHKDLSMNQSDGRYAVTTLAQASALVTAAPASGAPAPDAGFSVSASLGNSPLGAIDGAVSAVGGTGQFNIRVGDRDTVTVSTAGPSNLSDIDNAIRLAYGLPSSITTTSPLGSGSLQAVKILANTAGEDVVIESAPNADIARRLGLGVGQGGIEVGAHAARRPRPSGFVSVVGPGGDLGDLLAFAQVDRTALVSLTLRGGPDGFTLTDDQVRFPLASGILASGTASVPGTFSLLNLRENLQAVASAINGVQTKWRAEIHGYRLAVLPRFGTSSSGAGYNWDAVGAGWDLDGGGTLFNPSLTQAQRAAEALTGGTDGGPPQLKDYQDAFTVLDQTVDLFNILVLPRTHDEPEGRQVVWGPASAFCDRRRAFLLVDASLAASGVEQVLAEVATLRVGLVKDHAGLYWPPLTITAGPGLTKSIDPSGSIAGLMSRIDSSRGVWKAPAGLEADVRGIRGVSVLMSDPENGLLNPQAINAVRSFPNGVVSWGARTMDGFDNSGNDDYKYVPVRRFALFLEESLFRGLKFAVFEPNDEQLWGQIRLEAGAFLNNLFRQGAFAGKTTRDAYFVKVDSETTTQNDINLGIVNVLVGFAPLKPAEFVVVTVRQQAGQVQV